MNTTFAPQARPTPRLPPTPAVDLAANRARGPEVQPDASAQPQPASSVPPAGRADVVADSSYRRLLGEPAWNALAVEVRQRFSVAPGRSGSIAYRGTVQLRMSFLGALFARLCQLLGNILPPSAGRGIPVDVELSLDPAGGVRWLRRYRYNNGRHIEISSTKRLADDGISLLELVGRHFVMPLTLRENDGALEFVSTGYQLRLGRFRLRIPSLLTPGTTTVTHRQVAGALFRFTLVVRHRWLGQTIYQDGLFQGFARSVDTNLPDKLTRSLTK